MAAFFEALLPGIGAAAAAGRTLEPCLLGGGVGVMDLNQVRGGGDGEVPLCDCSLGKPPGDGDRTIGSSTPGGGEEAERTAAG
mmetsp:Transcript_56167/g.155519  ORF Transcript_56167/g.155519 Transcript_56167/m.155519 type:complete len:83 (+) Transcript_56167:178-426(+)